MTSFLQANKSKKRFCLSCSNEFSPKDRIDSGMSGGDDQLLLQIMCDFCIGSGINDENIPDERLVDYIKRYGPGSGTDDDSLGVDL